MRLFANGARIRMTGELTLCAPVYRMVGNRNRREVMA